MRLIGLGLPLAALTWAGLVSTAQAQEAGAGEAASGTIQEITVTAQKRKQSVQDVGITLSVVSGDSLVRSGANSVTDLTNVVPNLQANYGAGQVAFNVRGIGTNEFSANLDSPVAINVDEGYLAKTFMSGLLLFDIDRVEVLKGPQGTLFGRNATGGAVNFFTRRPTSQFSAGGTLSYDNYRTVRAEGYLSGPLSDTLSARVSGMVVDQGRGTYRNLTLGRREGFEKKWALRGQLQWESGPDMALLTVFGGQQNGELQPYEGVGIITPASFAAGAPAFCAPYLAGRATGASSGCVRGTDGRFPGDNDPFTSNNNRPHTVRNRSLGATLRYEHDFGNATLTSLTSYQSFTRRQHEDSDGSPVDTIDVEYFNRIRQFNTELRLNSKGESRWNYVLGLYYQRDAYRNGDYLTIARGAAPGFYSPFDQTSNALAAFFHNDVQLTDHLSLTAGVRYSWEKVAIKGGTFAGTGLGGDPLAPTTIVATLAKADTSRTDDDANFKLGIEWKPDVSGMFDKLMVYANVSTGFRSGSYNAEFTATQSALTSLAPEKITAYEAGFKSLLAHRTMQLNGAVFHYDFRDGFINVDSATSPVPITINAAGINTWGAELDWQWRPVSDLSLGLVLGWLDSRINSNITSGGANLNGARTVQSPRWTFTAQGS
ncbi:TonB-dependent receptor [Novosphingobium flavum]|uniref:TonB-dependent receptor n=1 Tax=Novosphingobium aerophilum TaxID=2839843 RepID=A0A7X1F8M1_9SPHN|nr:TonB-dependent receptor [Novosphingobium aerophilum]MBC2652378.1 TonB-dependent receptor [Novosphingobium aerophilum]MBC2662998.1 TonB-dependent receptor [Novosphingobium aerophilum]